MEDEDGNQMPEATKSAVRASARGYFEGMLASGTAPTTWGSVPLRAKNELTNILENQFPFLRLCDNHWKANMVATNSYSQWHPTASERAAAAKAKEAVKRRAAEANIIDLDTSEDDNKKTSKGPVDEKETVSRPSKRPRIEDPQPSPTTHPLRPRPTKFVPPRKKVCKLIYIDYHTPLK